MGNGFLDNWWRDLIAVVGVVGTMATLIALLISIWQIIRTRRASEATKHATSETLEKIRRQLSRYTAANLTRHLNEAQNAFDSQDWKMVVVRLGDLAEQAAQVLAQSDGSGTDWGQVASELRKWQNTIRTIGSSERKLAQSQLTKWNDFTQRTASQLDRLNLPF
jgi:hypothetical protein